MIGRGERGRKMWRGVGVDGAAAAVVVGPLREMAEAGGQEMMEWSGGGGGRGGG